MEKSLPKKKYYENIANTIIKNMEKRQIEGYYCQDKQSALKKALSKGPGHFDIEYIGKLVNVKRAGAF